jgi:hypothetical protein
MAAKPDKSNTTECGIYIPPGFQRVLELVAAQGCATTRDELAAGMRAAFEFDPDTGVRNPIDLDVWSSTEALKILNKGTRTREVARIFRRGRSEAFYETFLVIVSDKPPAVDERRDVSPDTDPKQAKPPPEEPKAWFDKARQQHPRLPKEAVGKYHHRLHNMMQSANVTEIWKLTTLRRRFYDKDK